MCEPDGFDVLPYLPGLLKCCRVAKETVDSSLLHLHLPLILGSLGCELSLTLLLFEFSLPFHTPLILTDSPFAIADLRDQDNLDCNLCHLGFKLATIPILPGLQSGFSSRTFVNRQ